VSPTPHHLTVTLTLAYPYVNITSPRLPPQSNGFFHGPHTTFTPDFVKSSAQFVHNPANKQPNIQTNKQTPIRSNYSGGGITEIAICVTHRRQRFPYRTSPVVFHDFPGQRVELLAL